MGPPFVSFLPSSSLRDKKPSACRQRAQPLSPPPFPCLSSPPLCAAKISRSGLFLICLYRLSCRVKLYRMVCVGLKECLSQWQISSPVLSLLQLRPSLPNRYQRHKGTSWYTTCPLPSPSLVLLSVSLASYPFILSQFCSYPLGLLLSASPLCFCTSSLSHKSSAYGFSNLCSSLINHFLMMSSNRWTDLFCNLEAAGHEVLLMFIRNVMWCVVCVQYLVLEIVTIGSKSRGAVYWLITSTANGDKFSMNMATTPRRQKRRCCRPANELPMGFCLDLGTPGLFPV